MFKRIIFQICFLIAAVAVCAFSSSSKAWAQVPPYCCSCCPSGCCCGPQWPEYTIVQCQIDCNNCRTYIQGTLRTNVENTVSNEHSNTQNHITSEHDDTRQHVSDAHIELQEFLFNSNSGDYDLFSEAILPALADMTVQIDSLLQAKIMAVGTFFDAQNHVQTQTDLGRLKRTAKKNYHPDTSLCLFGTQAKSLAASEQKGRLNKNVMGLTSFHNDLSTFNSTEYDILSDPNISKRRQFETVYCDPTDNNSRLGDWCAASVTPSRYNKDLNYASAIDNRWKLDIDFSDGVTNTTEEDVVALINNLYGYSPMPKISVFQLGFENSHGSLADIRSLQAKRNVAKNSFLSISAMKSNGSAVNTDYISGFLAHMGIPPSPDLEQLSTRSPSYYTQMEMLTKKVYQSPAFYNNLITEPTNIKRQRAAMQSIELMQQRDVFESVQRSEMLMSLLVEMKLRDRQKVYDLSLRKLRPRGGTALAP